MHPNPYEELQAEQQRLRQEVNTLKNQVNMLFSWFVERDALDNDAQRRKQPGHPRRGEVPKRAQWLLSQLPERFTVDDLIALSEETGLDALRAYQDLQLLIAAGRVEQAGEVFTKTGRAER